MDFQISLFILLMSSGVVHVRRSDHLGSQLQTDDVITVALGVHVFGEGIV